MTSFQSYGTVAATGSTIDDAALLTYHVNIITGGDDVKGVKLPLLNYDIDSIHLINTEQNKTIKVYPFSGNSFIGAGASGILALSGYRYSEIKRVSINQWVVNDPSILPGVQTVTAAGSTQGDATPLQQGAAYYVVEGADGTKGVKMPPAEVEYISSVKYLVNYPNNAILKLWPYSGDQLNILSINASMDIPAGKSATLLCIGFTTWAVMVGA